MSHPAGNFIENFGKVTKNFTLFLKFILKGDYYVKDFIISAVQWPVTPNLMFMTVLYAYTFAPHKIMIAEVHSSGSMQNGIGRNRKRVA